MTNIDARNRLFGFVGSKFALWIPSRWLKIIKKNTITSSSKIVK